MMKINTFTISLPLSLVCLITCAPYSLPEPKAYSAKEPALTLYLQSQDLYQLAEYPDALLKIDSAITINQNFAQFFELKGDILRKLNQVEPALRAYQTAILQRSNNTRAYINIADLYHQQNHFRESIRYYRKALTLDTTLIPVYLEITRNYISLKEWEIALNILEDYRRQSLVSGRPPGTEYYFLKGKSCFYQKNYQMAIQELLQYRHEKQPNREVLALLGRSYFALNNFEGGLKYFNKLIRMDAVHGEWYYYRGIYFYQVNNLEDSMNQLQMALEIDSTLYNCHYYLGKIYEQRGDDKKAVEEFRLYRESMRQLKDLGTGQDEIRDLEGFEEDQY